MSFEDFNKNDQPNEKIVSPFSQQTLGLLKESALLVDPTRQQKEAQTLSSMGFPMPVLVAEAKRNCTQEAKEWALQQYEVYEKNDEAFCGIASQHEGKDIATRCREKGASSDIAPLWEKHTTEIIVAVENNAGKIRNQCIFEGGSTEETQNLIPSAGK